MPTLEQIAETGIFSVGIDGSFQREFVPFNEELTAEMFAEEINSGRLSVKDAYDNFWSYEEDAELWDLGGNRRALLPRWGNIVFSMAGILEDSKMNEFVAVVCKSYFEFRKSKEGHYNPFEDDFVKTINFVREKDLLSKMDKELADFVSNKEAHNTRKKYKHVHLFDRIKNMDEIIQDKLLEYELERAFFQVLRSDENVRNLVDDDDFFDSYSQKRLIEQGHCNEGFIRLLDSEDDKLVKSAVLCLGITRCYHAKLAELLDSGNNKIKAAVIEAFGRMRHYDERLVHLLDKQQIKISGAGKALERIDDPMVLYDIKRIHGLKNKYVKLISYFHNKLKPRGYNPTVKKLAALNANA